MFAIAKFSIKKLGSFFYLLLKGFFYSSIYDSAVSQGN